ncbi:NADP-dependent oxidoreductase [Paenibacillus sp. Aloe-11]|uniref:NADP-dependent oxidoreductase n=1 Tax=Paenibacillus sp. Aloe-11 TaxID=1050222 RepID=UPI00024EF6EE|nr:NADP-dependent oxidoreductase [Paenibacillus sp. Aloe-11]EHS59141.1 alcohol dehydrogenase, zinc-dependent [Paenibacillus sp. Aloe-11]
MKAIALTSFGVPEALEELEIPVPALTDTQVLIEMRASSINPADIQLRSGAILQSPMADKFPAQLPLVLGIDVAGIVKEVGEKVRHFKPGDRVMGMVPMGSYMDYVAVEEDHLAVISESLSFEEAGAVPTVALTAWQALFEHGRLQPGEHILIHAGAGGVGHAAIQLAKQHGAYVIATARDYNHDFVKGLGADEVLDYTKVDFAAKITEPVGIVLDSAMDPSTFGTGLPGDIGEKNYSVIKDAGTYISVVAFAINQYPKVRGIDARFFQAKPNRTDFEAIVRQIQKNKLNIHIDKTYPFTAQGLFQAYRKSEELPKRGKIVISKNMG